MRECDMKPTALIGLRKPHSRFNFNTVLQVVSIVTFRQDPRLFIRVQDRDFHLRISVKSIVSATDLALPQ